VLKEVGAGVQLGSNGTRVLYALGLQDALVGVQVIPSAREIRHWRAGETWNWFDLGATSAKRYGTPHVMLHRSDLLSILAEAFQRLKPMLLSVTVDAQSINDIKKALTVPAPVVRGLSVPQDSTQRGVTIVEPTNVSPPSIDLHIPFDFNSDQLLPDGISFSGVWVRLSPGCEPGLREPISDIENSRLETTRQKSTMRARSGKISFLRD
jgi:hypothetical protein